MKPIEQAIKTALSASNPNLFVAAGSAFSEKDVLECIPRGSKAFC